MAVRTALSFALLLWLPGLATADWLGVWRPPPFSTIQQIRSLSPDQADDGVPVSVTGVVTHVSPRSGEFWVQDQTGGIHVLAGVLGREVSPGLRVEVAGVTNRGEFAPCVEARQVTVLGAAELPPGIPYSLSTDESCWLDAQFVHAYGVVLNARSVDQTTRIDVLGRNGHAVLVLEGVEWARAARKLRNHEVSFRGVCSARSADRRVCNSPVVYINELPTQVPLPPREPEGEGPTRVIDNLLEFTPHSGLRHVKVVGVVTAAPLPNLLLVQDRSGGVSVWTDRPAGFAPGTQVHVTGLARVEGRRVSIGQAQVKELGTGSLPAPADASAAELASGSRDAVIVRLSGRLEEVRAVDLWTAATIVEDGQRFDAFIPGLPQQNGLSNLEIGSRVAVIGVSAEIAPGGARVNVPSLFLTSSNSITVLEPPPPPPGAPSWWTSTRAGYVVGGFAMVLLLGFGWVVSLRVQVRRAAEEMKQHYEEKARLERQLRQASKLEAVGRLAGGIAHDFNNLLTVINGCAELLSEETARDGGRLSGLTDDIRKAGERAASLTGQLLTFSRKREVGITAVNLNEVVADTLRLLDRVIGEDIRIETDLASDLPAIRGEPGLLHQVMMNLAVNARDAMPQGGVMRFTTSLVAEPDAGADGKSGPARNVVRLTVADSGVGMSDEVKARLFEPFFTTKDIGSGTGLGLATVYGIIQTIGGRVRVDSALGSGTKFHIDLRVHGETLSDSELAMNVATPLPPTRAANLAALLGKTVLVVEDNEMVRQTLLAGLSCEGATVLSADRPETALQIIASHRGLIDVLVTDVVMPGMSGPSLAERARETRPEMMVIFISGYTADEVLRQGVLEEQVEFLQKPFTPDHLIRRLRRVLARGTGPEVTASAP